MTVASSVDVTTEYDPTASEGWNFHKPSPGTWHVVTHDAAFLRVDPRNRRVDLWRHEPWGTTLGHERQMLVLPAPVGQYPATVAEARDLIIALLPALIAASKGLA